MRPKGYLYFGAVRNLYRNSGASFATPPINPIEGGSNGYDRNTSHKPLAAQHPRFSCSWCLWGAGCHFGCHTTGAYPRTKYLRGSYQPTPASYRLFRRWPALAAALGGLAGTLTNTIGVLGILLWLGTFPGVLLVPIFSMNVPIEIILALVITVPAVAAIRAVARGQIAGVR